MPQQPHQTTTSLSDCHINSDPASVYYLHTSKVCLKNFLEVEKVLHSFEDIQIKWTVFAATNKIDSTQYPHSETGTEVHQMMDLLAAKISTKTRRLFNSEVNIFFLFHRQPQHCPTRNPRGYFEYYQT